jgi:hypothetical protein
MASRWLERLYRGNKLAVISGAVLLAAFLILNAFFLGHRSTAEASGPRPASPQQTQHPRPQPSHLRTTSHELEVTTARFLLVVLQNSVNFDID